MLDAFEDLRDERGLDYNDVKRDGLEQADQTGDQFASIFLLFGTFSIMAGILLIALIFVMLAAERKRELGISRAVGAQRGDIVRLFTFEGAVYSLAAAAVGSALGIVVGLVMVRVISAALGAIDDFDGFEIVFAFRWQSLLLAYTLGMVVTYLVVIVSAARVSALNIVRAVRDIPEPPKEGNRLREYWRTVGVVYLDGLRAIPRLRPLRVLRRLLLSGPCAIVRLAWALFMAGYLMTVLGVLLTLNGISVEQLGVFSVGLSLIVVGVPLSLRHAVRLPERIAYTAAGVVLVALWLVPVDWEEFGLPQFNEGIELFILFRRNTRGWGRMGRHVQLGVPGQRHIGRGRAGANARPHHQDRPGIPDGEPLPDGDDPGDVLARHLHAVDHRLHRRRVQQRIRRPPGGSRAGSTSQPAPASPTPSATSARASKSLRRWTQPGSPP